MAALVRQKKRAVNDHHSHGTWNSSSVPGAKATTICFASPGSRQFQMALRGSGKQEISDSCAGFGKNGVAGIAEANGFPAKIPHVLANHCRKRVGSLDIVAAGWSCDGSRVAPPFAFSRMEIVDTISISRNFCPTYNTNPRGNFLRQRSVPFGSKSDCYSVKNDTAFDPANSDLGYGACLAVSVQ